MEVRGVSGTDRATFPKDVRLRRRWEFDNVQTRGRRVHTTHFVMLVLPSQSPRERKRIGITVSKKVSQNAVVRNRVKRLVREVFRRHRDIFPEADVVVIAKPGAGDLDLPGVLAQIEPTAPALRRAAMQKPAGRATPETRPRTRRRGSKA
jgi:ribonuclease P protein component